MSTQISASAFNTQPQAAAGGSTTITTAATTSTSRAGNRQTRTNPSRTSKTLGRTSFAFGHRGSIAESSTATAATAAAQLPHGFYPALTHFTDAITALPREFRRHNSLLKEVDAKAWALEENLLQLLEVASESRAVPYPATPAPIVAGVVREDFLPKDLGQPPESQESKNRRLLFERVRYTLSDLMMTADEKNHVITNANDELDRQLQRLNSIFPYIAGEISDESRLGSLTHWAYSNKDTAKAAASERPRREVASNKQQDLAQALHDAEAASRSEARREAVQARKQRRAHVESDFDETRVPGSRKAGVGKSRGGEHAAADQPTTGAGSAAPAKRRKVERAAQPAEGGAAMERTTSATGTGGRAVSKETAGSDATKKRARAPNAGTTAARKRNNTGATVDSALGASSPVVGTFTVPRAAASPGPNATARPSSSRTAQHSSLQGSNARQRPSSSASNRVTSNNKTTDLDRKFAVRDGLAVKADGAAPLSKPPTPHSETAPEPPQPSVSNGVDESGKREDSDSRPEQKPSEPAADSGGHPPQTAVPSSNPPAKGRSSKTSTPILGTAELAPPRARQTRNGAESAAPTTTTTTTTTSSAVANPTTTTTTTNASKRTQKKTGSTSAAVATTGASAHSRSSVPAFIPSEDEESYLEGDDEDDEGEPRYCYCNGVSFGDMIACDNDACPREWFHLECLKMSKPPAKNVKWYCNECKENMNIGANVKRGRNGR